MAHHDTNADSPAKANESAKLKDGTTSLTGNGLSSGLQPGGTLPGGGPGASVGSVGTGGASTAGAGTGNTASGGH
ncbi:hypothetical protein [Sphingomonas xinjiangensis]|uniref:Uncharacterized protein n=1 Tax=Sphingomonas xinjiangensis TaxID=643568 RepID=A0A840YFU4_9SPHN|nr:hypothetical protein [Sphingomonas xinjiangensis]MBB5712317.1 hypothetical protein [Sphingomonas xinjiangensis]